MRKIITISQQTISQSVFACKRLPKATLFVMLLALLSVGLSSNLKAQAPCVLSGMSNTSPSWNGGEFCTTYDPAFIPAPILNYTGTCNPPSYNYSWEKKVNSDPWTTVASGTASPTVSAYNPPAQFVVTSYDVIQFRLTVVDIANGNQTAQSSNFILFLAANMSATNVNSLTCLSPVNGMINLTVLGGLTTKTYTWTGSAGGVVPPSQTNVEDPTGLTAGDYNVVVNDGGGCPNLSYNVTISAANALSASISSTTNILCFGASTGAATVAPTFGAPSGSPTYTYSWSPSGGTGATASSLAAGTYTVSVTDGGGCVVSTSTTLTQPATAVSATTTNLTNVSCFGGSNGSAGVTAGGGVPGYSYSWAPSGGTASSATGLAAGIYTVTVTDANMCTKTSTVTITEPTAVTASTTNINNVSCFGGSNGSASVLAGGGTLPSIIINYTTTAGGPGYGGIYVFDSSLTLVYSNPFIYGSTSGSTPPIPIINPPYRVIINSIETATCSGQTITYQAFCSPSMAPLGPVVFLNGTCQTSIGNSPGHLLAPCGGGYTYSWAPTGGTAATASGLAAGTYTVTTSDANGCTATSTVSINQPSTLAATTSVDNNVTCNGTANGSASVVATGGTAPYGYSWAPTGGTGATASGLAAGTYTVTVTDLNLCTTTATAVVTQPTAVTGVTSVISNVSCNGGANGQATVVASGGTGYGNYTVDYTMTFSATSISPNPTQSLEVQVADGSGNIVATTGTINNYAPIGGTTHSNSLLSFQGNNPPYSLVLVGEESAGGTASVSADVICDLFNTTVASGSLTLTPNGGPEDDSTSVPTCYGSTAAYTYSWAGSGGTDDTTTNTLTAGTYTVTITDAQGCTGTATTTISEPTAVTATTSSIAPSCPLFNNGTASVVAGGGTPGYTYLWSTGGTTASISGLSAGPYTVTVTDTNLCSATSVVTLTNNPSGPVHNITTGINYCTIQSAIDAVITTNGDTITVDAGNYIEDVVINKSLTVNGPNANTTCSGTRAAEANITGLGGSGTVAVKILADGVTLNGFNISNPNGSFGVSEQGRSNVSVLYNIVSNVGNATTGSGPSYGIHAESNAASANIFFNYNCVSDIRGGTNGCVLNMTSNGGGFGIGATSSNSTNDMTNLNISYNSITNISACNFNGTGGKGAYGVIINIGADTAAAGKSIDAIVSNNVISGLNGRWAHGVGLEGHTQGAMVLNNDINTFTSAAGNAVGVFVEQNDGVATVQVHQNSLTGMVYGVANANAAIYVQASLNATCNWYGSAVLATVTASNGGNVTFTPYELSGTDTNPAIGFQPAAGCIAPCALVLTMSSVTASCPMFNNGTASVVVTGGTGTYTYLWSNGDTGATADSLITGTYTVTVTDVNGCTSSNTVLVGTTYLPLVNPTDSSSTVECYPSGLPTYPVVLDVCGTAITPTGPVPSGTFLGCEGTLIYTYTYTDTWGSSVDWAYTYTIDRTTAPVVPANGADTVECLASATAPTTPTVTDVCGSNRPAVLISTIDAPSTLTCEGTRTYNYTYTDSCDITLVSNWSFVYTIEHTTAPVVPVNGADTVECLASATTPTPPTVIDVCGISVAAVLDSTIDAPVSLTCEGSRTYYYSYTDCSGLKTPWTFTYSIDHTTAPIDASDPPVSNSSTVACASSATAPTSLPVIKDVCGTTLMPTGAPSIGGTSTMGCAGTITYTYNYVDCSSLPFAWTYTYTVSAPTPVVLSCPNDTTTAACRTQGFIDTAYAAWLAQASFTGGCDAVLTNNSTGAPSASGGSVTVTFTVTSTCQADATCTKTFTVPATVTIDSISKTNVSCNGGNNGSATVHHQGGTAPYSYSWIGSSSTTGTASPLAPGSYTVTVTDVNGCSVSGSVTITQPATLAASETHTNVLCNGGSTGTATISATGGTLPYTGTGTFTSLSAGTHTYMVTDANSCTSTVSVVITSPSAIVPVVTITPVSCFGLGNGSAVVAVPSGGTPFNPTIAHPLLYNYSWSTGGTGVVENLIIPGTHTLTLTDSNGCTGSTVFTMTQPPLLVATATVVSNINCNGDSTGHAIVAITGGTPIMPFNTYNIDWSSGGTFLNEFDLWAATHTVVVSDANGCIASSSVTITQAAPITGTSSVSACNSYMWNSINYTISGVYVGTFMAANGCDSIHTLTLTINHSNTGSSNHVACNSTVVAGVTYTVSGSHTATYTNAANCDSVHTYNVTINYSNTGSSNHVACNSTVVAGVTYTVSGSHTATFTNASNCDSVHTYNVTINYSNTGSSNHVACNSTVVAGVTYTVSGSHTATFTNASNCDSVHTYNVTINYSNTGSSNHVACNSTVVAGVTYTVSGSHTATFTNASNCDSVHTYNVTINNSNTGSSNHVACNSTVVAGVTYTVSGSHTETFTNAVNCDSVHTYNVTINNSNSGSSNHVACNSTVVGGVTYTVSGSHTETFMNVSNCDSVHTYNVTINYSNTGSSNHVACNSTIVGGLTYTVSGSHTATFTNASNCDSVHTYNVTINYSNTGSSNHVACNSTVVAGVTYTISGSHTATFTNASNCDSVHTYNVTINNSNTGSSNHVACNSTVVAGVTYTISGSHTETFTNAVNCDSVHTYNVTINNSNSGSSNHVACNSTVVGGVTYTVSGSHTETFMNVSNCDSVHTYNVTINYSNTGSSNHVACNSTIVGGVTYTVSGSHTATFMNASNCDSVHTYNVTINYSNTGSSNHVACNSTVVAGVTYTVSGSHTATFTNASNCDSVHTYNVTINNSNTGSSNHVACNSTVVAGVTYTISGSHTATFTNAVNCDSVHTYNVTINHSSSSTISHTASLTYTWPVTGLTYTASGTYFGTIANGNSVGCDSNITLNLTILGVTLSSKVFLDGPYNGAGLMHDSLRAQGNIPMNEPYSIFPFFKATIGDASGETAFPGYMADNGNASIVDWVFLELRQGTLPNATTVFTQRALVRRDGQIVSEIDGVSPVTFSTAPAGNYYVSVKHRNHLGVMTNALQALTLGGATVDFTTIPLWTKPSIPAIVNTPARLVSGVQVLWAGDAKINKNVKYNGSLNDKEQVLFVVGSGTPNNVTLPGYRNEDVNMDGVVKYNNTNADRLTILNTVGTGTQNAIYNQHTPD